MFCNINLILAAMIMMTESSKAYILGDRLLDKSYEMLGDLNIGGIFPVTTYNATLICGVSLYRQAMTSMEIVEVLAYAVHTINKNPMVLPGIKLGFVFLDSCTNPQAGVLQAIRFLPQSKERDYTKTTIANYLHSYKIVGVIGTAMGHITFPVSIMLGGAGIPIISFWDTGDDLSNKRVHPTFMRVVPPDSYHVLAILNFMQYNGWQYYSVLAQDDEFGRASMKVLFNKAKEFGMCRSLLVKVADNSEFETIVGTLLRSSAKVVVALISEVAVARLIKAIKIMDANGKLIWIGSDRWLEFMYFNDILSGNFVVSSSPLELPGYPEFFSNLTKNADHHNPWFARSLKEFIGCEENECDGEILKESAGKITLSSADIYDTMMTYAYGLHTLMQVHCPNIQGAKAAECFKTYSNHFMNYLMSVKFEGASGTVYYDDKGDRLSNLYIYQAIKENKSSNDPSMWMGGLSQNIVVKRVAYYSINKKTLYSYDNLTTEWVNFDINLTLIDSRCQIPCLPDEYKSYVKACCWLCRKCQENERVVDNDTSCQKCPALHWPALQDNKFSTCEKIEVTVFDWFHPATMSILIADGVGVILVFFVLATLWLNQSAGEEDTSTVLVIIQIVAIVWGFMAAPVFLMRPTNFNCITANTLFLVSFSVLYLAMLLRTIEVYRKCFKVIEEYELKYTGPGYQVMLTTIVAITKIATFVTLGFMYPIRAVHLQPIISEKLVELVCDIPVPHTVTFLLFSMVLLLLCSIFALKSQNDPYGFERNRFVSMYVVISLIMWIAFMPAYFTAIHHRMKAYFIILAILVNHNSALILNFTPAFLEMCLRRRKSSGTAGYGYFRNSRQSGNTPAAKEYGVQATKLDKIKPVSHLAANPPDEQKKS